MRVFVHDAAEVHIPIAKLVDERTWSDETLISWIPGNEHVEGAESGEYGQGSEGMTRVGIGVEHKMLDAIFPISDLRRRRIGLVVGNLGRVCWDTGAIRGDVNWTTKSRKGKGK